MGRIINLDKEELLNKYSEYANRKNMDIQRYSMFPIGVKSDHKGEQVTFTKAAAEQVIKKLNRTPITYVEGDGLPTGHRDSEGKRKVIGTSIGGGIYKDESGIEWAYNDALIYNDAEADIYHDIIEHQSELGTSIEAEIAVDNDHNIHNADYLGLSILSNKHSAWQTQLLVADKGEVATVEVTYDDLIKKVVGDDYSNKLSEKDKSINEIETQLESQKSEYESKLKEKEEMIAELNNDNSSLRELNTKFGKLLK